MTLSIEVLPAPFGPMMARISPLRISNDTPVTALTPPKERETFSTASSTSPGERVSSGIGELGIEITANAEERALAVLDVFQSKLIKRGISLKALETGEPRQSGKEVKISGTFTQGINQEQAKKVSKLIRDEGPKSVKVQIQGDELRVSSKSRDDLQSVIALVKGADLDFAAQFVNYR